MSSIFRALGKSPSEDFRLRGVAADFVELCGVPEAGATVLLAGLADGSKTQQD